MRVTIRHTFAALAFVVLATPASAYIGPGVGAGAIAVVLGVIGSILMAVVAILWFPVKRILKRRKSVAGSAQASAEPKAPDASDGA